MAQEYQDSQKELQTKLRASCEAWNVPWLDVVHAKGQDQVVNRGVILRDLRKAGVTIELLMRMTGLGRAAVYRALKPKAMLVQKGFNPFAKASSTMNGSSDPT